MTSIENGNYGQAVMYGGAMLAEQVLSVATLGQGQAASTLGRTVTASEGAAVKAVDAATANKVNHIFSQERHNLGGVAKALGGENKAFKAIEKATEKAVDTSKAGRFETTVKVGGEQVTVRGSVVDGQVKIGTAFVKEELKK